MYKNGKRAISITLHKTQVQVGQRPQPKTRYTKLDARERRNSLQHIGTGDNLLNRTPVVQALSSISNKWDLMKLKSFYKAKDTIIGQYSSLQNEKQSSTTHM